MRRQAFRELIGTAVAFLILCALTVGFILIEYALEATKGHKAGG